ncbi:MAG: hypothetical protein M1825_005290 [Sarcosagium campestre]|nr:MAG: hypothetical protein M1825_005290 [Sarcosagium campestre]
MAPIEMSEKQDQAAETSSTSSTAVGSDVERQDNIETSASPASPARSKSKLSELKSSSLNFRRSKSGADQPTEPRSSLFQRSKDYFTYTPRNRSEGVSGLNRYQRFRYRCAQNYTEGSFVACLVLFFFWALINGLLIVWQYYNVQAHTRPYDYRKLVHNKHAWNAFTIILYLLSFLMIVPNACFAIGTGIPFKLTYNCLNMGNWAAAKHPGRQENRIWTRIKTLSMLVFLLVAVTSWLAVGIAITAGQLVAVFAATPITWKFMFRHSCDDFGIRVWLDNSVSTPATSVEFIHYDDPEAKFRMQFRPNPQETNDFYNVFSLDPGYIPSSNSFIPPYDAIHYNFTDLTYSTRLANRTLHSARFELQPRLRIPDLQLEADMQDFVTKSIFEPFLKVYSTNSDSQSDVELEDEPWADNTNVMMRTVKYSSGDHLQVCARSATDALEGLGDMTAVPVGLIILLRSDRKITSSDSED